VVLDVNIDGDGDLNVDAASSSTRARNPMARGRRQGVES
jgi:hypothetical protein